MALQKVFYLLSNFVLILCIIELVRHRKIRNTEAFKSKAEKTAELALSPEKQAEELLRTVSIYRKVVNVMIQKVKCFFKWLWGNKQALTSIVGSLLFMGLSQYALYSDLLLRWDFFVSHTLAFQIVVGVLTGLFLVNLIYTIINQYGIENLGQIANRLEQHKLEKESKLTKEQKAAIKNQYKSIENALKNAEAKYNDLMKIINDYNALSSIVGYSIPSERINEYNDAMNKVNSARSDVELLKKNKEELHEALKK